MTLAHLFLSEQLVLSLDFSVEGTKSRRLGPYGMVQTINTSFLWNVVWTY